MRSYSVTCHPAEVTFPPLPQPKLVLDLATMEGCKAELTCIPQQRFYDKDAVMLANWRSGVNYKRRLSSFCCGLHTMGPDCPPSPILAIVCMAKIRHDEPTSFWWHWHAFGEQQQQRINAAVATVGETVTACFHRAIIKFSTVTARFVMIMALTWDVSRCC